MDGNGFAGFENVDRGLTLTCQMRCRQIPFRISRSDENTSRDSQQGNLEAAS